MGIKVLNFQPLNLSFKTLSTAAVEHGDSLSILEDMNSFADNNTQSIPLPATETSDMKGGVVVKPEGGIPYILLQRVVMKL